VDGVRCGALADRCPLSDGTRDISVAEAARLLADWRAELGYLQLADAVQMLTDTFGDRFVRPSTSGCGCIRCDVLATLQTLAPTEWVNEVDCWES
jgi:hypothetical protein